MEEKKKSNNEGPISCQMFLLTIGLVLMVTSIVILATTGTRTDWLFIISAILITVAQI